jgi:hypothetical protein
MSQLGGLDWLVQQPASDLSDLPHCLGLATCTRSGKAVHFAAWHGIACLQLSVLVFVH